MKREDLKEIISSVIEKMKQDTPEAACGLFWGDNPGGEDGPSGNIFPVNPNKGVETTLYAVGEEA